MGTVSRVHTFASGAILTAAQLNNEFDNLLTSSAINGGLDATNLGVTAGQATASKALVVDASRNLADATGSNRINNLALSGTLESTGAITATAGITSGGNIVSDTDSTDDLGTTGVRWANLFVDDITVTNNVTIGGTLTLTGGITLNGNTTIGDSSADTLTVNSTITSNLIFTDNTYDIGASGATRPRNLYLSGNGVVGGTLGVTGLITASGGVSGALTGNVTGNVTGDVTGDVTGNLTGNVTGNVTGNLTGDVTGNISGNVTGGTISGTTGTFSGAVTVNDTIRLDTGDTTVSDGDVFGDVEFYDNDGGSASAGVTAKIQAVAVGSYGASNILFSTSSSSGGARTALTERVKIASDGDLAVDTDTLFVDASADRVGINTSSPTASLTVAGPNTATSIGSTSAIEILDGNADNEFVNLRFATGANGSLASIGAKATTTGAYPNSVGELHFAIQNGSTTHTAMVIDENRNVGIGTTVPTTLLELKSSSGPEITLSRSDTVIADGDVVGGIQFSSNDTSTAFGSPPHIGAGIKVKASGTVGLQNMYLYAGQNNLGYENDTPSMQLVQSGDVIFYNTSPANGMHWDASASSLGIGTSSPSSLLNLESASTPTLLITDTRTPVTAQYQVGSSIAYVGTTTNHALGFTTNGSERARITSAGNFGIGTSSPAVKFAVTDGPNTGLEINPYHGGLLVNLYAYDRNASAYRDLQIAGEELIFKTGSGGSVTERARIDTSGNLIVGKTTTSAGTAGASLSATGGATFVRDADCLLLNRPSTTGAIAAFRQANSEVGTISVTASATAYNTSSDYRLKENVVGITDGITRIKSLKPSRFNFIAEADRTVDGFVAHEVSDIVPEAISGAKDAVDEEGNPEYQGIDQSKLVPLLTAALQEAITKIETLETKVAALEAA